MLVEPDDEESATQSATPLDFSNAEFSLTALGEPADWQKLYGRPGPLTVEIGCGGGRTVISMAEAAPARNFLGIERAGEYYRILRERAAKRALPNLRVTRTDAMYLIARFFPPQCVEEYHIYFPDPWPKKRHHKRRLFTDEFCQDIKRTLIPTGVLYVATDHLEYYTEILPRLQAVFAVEEHKAPWADAPGGRTNYEIKYIKQGRPIYRLIARLK